MTKRSDHKPWVQAPVSLLESPDLSAEHVRLLLLLIRYCNPRRDMEYSCFPGNTALAAAMGCSTRRVQQLLSELEGPQEGAPKPKPRPKAKTPTKSGKPRKCKVRIPQEAYIERTLEHGRRGRILLDHVALQLLDPEELYENARP